MSHEDLAGFWMRLLAHICDQISSFLIVLPVSVVMYVAGFSQSFSLVISTLAGAWLIAFWTSRRGGSPLRVMLGVFVIDKNDGAFLSYRRALLRAMFPAGLVIGSNFVWILVIPALLDYMNSLWDKNSQTWHDKAAGSVVVKR